MRIRPPAFLTPHYYHNLPKQALRLADELATGGRGEMLYRRLQGEPLTVQELLGFAQLGGMPRPYLQKIQPGSAYPGANKGFTFTGSLSSADELNTDYELEKGGFNEAWNLLDELGSPIGTIIHDSPNYRTSFGPSDSLHVHEAWIEPKHRNLKNLSRLTKRIRRSGKNIDASFANEDLRKVFVKAANRGQVKSDPDFLRVQERILDQGPTHREMTRRRRREGMQHRDEIPGTGPAARRARMQRDPRIETGPAMQTSRSPLIPAISLQESLGLARRIQEMQPFVDERAIQAWRRAQTPRGSIHPAVARLRTPRARQAQERMRHRG